MTRYVLVLTALLIPGALQAQEPDPAWRGLDRSALSTVFVLDDAGLETRGQLLRLDPDAVVVLVNGSERRFETRSVARVSKRGDSLKNGAISGLVVGITMGILGAVVVDCGQANRCREAQFAQTVLSTGLYTAIGTAIDAAVQGRTVLYQAPTPRATIQSRGGAAISVRLTW
jgi:hypothetical protein